MNRQEALMMMGQSVVQGPGGVLMAPTGPDGALVPIPMKEGALAGTKRSRAEREAMAPRLNNLTPQQQQQLIGNAYQMALATGSTGMGMEDLQAQQMAMNFGKGYKIGPGGVVAGPNGQPKKQNRRSKAQLAAAAATANASNAATNGAAAALGDTQSNQIARGPTSTASNGAFYSNKTAARGSLMTVSAERKFFEQVWCPLQGTFATDFTN